MSFRGEMDLLYNQLSQKLSCFPPEIISLIFQDISLDDTVPFLKSDDTVIIQQAQERLYHRILLPTQRLEEVCNNFKEEYSFDQGYYVCSWNQFARLLERLPRSAYPKYIRLGTAASDIKLFDIIRQNPIFLNDNGLRLEVEVNYIQSMRSLTNLFSLRNLYKLVISSSAFGILLRNNIIRIPEWIKDIKFSRSDIQSISTLRFENIKRLTFEEESDLQFSSFANLSSSQLLKLEYFIIDETESAVSSNEEEVASLDFLGGLSNLKELNFKSNKGLYFNYCVNLDFSNSPKLRKIYINTGKAFVTIENFICPANLEDLTIVMWGLNFDKLELSNSIKRLCLSRSPFEFSLDARIFPASLIELDLSCNYLIGVLDLSHLTRLEKLSLDCNSDLDLESVKMPSNLKELIATYVNIKDVSKIRFPAFLRSLSIGSHNTVSFESCNFPPNLERLEIQGKFNKIYRSMFRLPNSLKVLVIKSNINVFESFFKLPNLINFECYSQKNVRGDDIGKHTVEAGSIICPSFEVPQSLKTLSFSAYRISSLKNLKLPNGLTYLNIHANRLNKIDTKLPNSLETLIVSDNLLDNVSNWEVPKSLKFLYLKGNRISLKEQIELAEKRHIIVDL